MKRRMKLAACIVVFALLLAGLSGGKLARPERVDREEDRLIGVHMVYEKLPQAVNLEDPDAWAGEGTPPDRTHWVDYGEEEIQVGGVGPVSFPHQILIGTYDPAQGCYVFPGLEGRNAFLAVQTLPDGSQVYQGYTGLADAALSVGGAEETLGGTVYYGPPLEGADWESGDYGWTAYRVFQMPDGTVYLDGSGDRYGGGGSFGFSVKTESTVTEHGQETTQSFEVSVDMACIPRLREVTVKQFDAEDTLLRTDVIAAADVDPEAGVHEVDLRLESGTAWVLFVQQAEDGTVQRTLVQPQPEEELSHTVWFLDRHGMGLGVLIWVR